MGDGDQTEETGRARADNVIEFPRDWFGSKDDLVPFGPAADRLEAEAAARAADRATEGDTSAAMAATDEDLASAMSAHAFWTGSSGTLHEPVDVRPEDESFMLAAADDAPALLAAPTNPRSLLVVPDQVVVRGRVRLPVPLRAAGAALAALAAVMVAVLVVSPGSGSVHRAGAVNATLAAAQQVPNTIDTAPGPGTPTSSDVALANRARAKTPIAPRTGKKPAARSRRAAHTKIAKRRAVAKHSVTAGHAASTVVADAPADDLSSSEPVSDDSVSAAGTGAAVTSSGGSAASGSTSGSSGPGGLGGAVGPNCNPTCSAK